MDVNVHAAHTKPTESRLIGCADFVGVTRRFTCARQGIVGWVMDFAHRGAYQSCGAAASDWPVYPRGIAGGNPSRGAWSCAVQRQGTGSEYLCSPVRV